MNGKKPFLKVRPSRERIIANGHAVVFVDGRAERVVQWVNLIAQKTHTHLACHFYRAKEGSPLKGHMRVMHWGGRESRRRVEGVIRENLHPLQAAQYNASGPQHRFRLAGYNLRAGCF